jgi:hypothetical protein
MQIREAVREAVKQLHDELVRNWPLPVVVQQYPYMGVLLHHGTTERHQFHADCCTGAAPRSLL